MDYKTLKAGDLTVEYARGKLRYIKFGSNELIRGIYFAVRDSNWGTLPLQYHQERLEYHKAGFTLTFRACSTANTEAVVDWECTIKGDENNRITFAINGTFVREYASNRVGFCVLHPLNNLLGQPFEVHSPREERQNVSFPDLIAPHQLATNIAGLSWRTSNDITCQLTFEGELFEMEDQRNWTDASFKTYCTPLEMGWPKRYHEGDTVSQKVVFQMLSYRQKDCDGFLVANSVSFDTDFHFPWPGIGSRIPNGPEEEQNAEKIAALPLTTLRADIVWGGKAWENSLKTMVAYAQKCRKPLHLILHYAQGEILPLVNTLHQHCPPSVLTAVSVVSKDRSVAEQELVQTAFLLIYRRFPKVKIGSGTQYLFTQFNRNRPQTDQRADFIFFGNNAQVHAFDNQSIIETIGGQGETIKSARNIAPEMPIHVSPIAMNAPFSPDKLPADPTARETLIYDFAPDPRQGSLFTAGWMLGCLAALTRAGASHLDFFETEGGRGLIINQKITASFSLLDRILKREPIRLFFSQGSYPLQFSSLGVATLTGEYLYVANHTEAYLSMKAGTAWFESSVLNSDCAFSDFERIPESRMLDLPPHGILEITLSE